MESSNTGTSIIQIIIEFLLLFIPKTLVKRIVAMVLISADVPNSKVTELSGLCDRSVRSIKKSISDGNAKGLLSLKNGSGSRCKTKGLEEQIIAEIERNNYHTYQEIADMVEEKFNIKISTSSVRRLLKKNDIKRLKAGSLPAKADMQKQRDFYEGKLKPLMDKAENKDDVLLFMDASHFVLGCDFLGYIYGKKRRYIKTYSGRKRYNVLGAIDYISKSVLTVTNDCYITATEVCMLLRKIAEQYEGKTVHIVLDNARYQKCAVVQELAKELHIDLVYLPPYSPNLNLIERFWKFVKGELRSKYYNDFLLFQRRIDEIIESASNSNKRKVSSLIGKKIQLFDGLSSLCQNTLATA